MTRIIIINKKPWKQYHIRICPIVCVETQVEFVHHSFNFLFSVGYQTVWNSRTGLVYDAEFPVILGKQGPV